MSFEGLKLVNRDTFQDSPRDASRGGGKTTAVSMLSSVGAVFAACSCCILPMVLVGLGLSTTLSSFITPVGQFRWPLVAVSVLLVAVSWLMVIRKHRQDCDGRWVDTRRFLRSPETIMLLVASVLTLVAATWSAFEPALMRAML